MTFTSPKQDGPSLMISGDFDVPSSVISLDYNSTK
jgi:hypothetical protein